MGVSVVWSFCNERRHFSTLMKTLTQTEYHRPVTESHSCSVVQVLYLFCQPTCLLSDVVAGFMMTIMRKNMCRIRTFSALVIIFLIVTEWPRSMLPQAHFHQHVHQSDSVMSRVLLLFRRDILFKDRTCRIRDDVH